VVTNATREKEANLKQIAIAVDNTTIMLEYSWIGSEQPLAPLIVFLHEGLGSAAQWGDWPRRLCAAMGWRGLLFSRYGYGRSQPRPVSASGDGWPLDYMAREAHLYLPALFDALGIDAARQHPVLVGHSDGATVALLYAAAFPQHPRSVVALAPHVFTEQVARTRIARFRAERGTPAGVGLAHHLAGLHGDPAGVFEGWSGRWVSLAFATWNVAVTIESIACPLLAIQGRHDQFGTLAQLEEVRRRVPHAELLVLEQCRHVPHQERPEATIKAITAFLLV
jgi:pimeloyl-ACP methyl ester carboxylesterase